MESLLKKGVLSENLKFYTFSVSSLATGESYTMIRMLSKTDQIIRKENIDALIEKCLAGEFSKKSQKTNIEDEPIKPTEAKNRREEMMQTEAILESFRKHPMLSSTTYISPMILILPRIRDLQAQRIEINNEALKSALKMFGDRWKLSKGLEPRIMDYNTGNGFFKLIPIKSNALPSIESERTEKEQKYTQREDDIDPECSKQRNKKDLSAGFSGVRDLTTGDKASCLILKLKEVDLSYSSDAVYDKDD